MAGASKDLVLGSSASQGAGPAGHGSSNHLTDGRSTKCPYHAHMLQEPLSYRARDISANIMDRFMIHHPGEQYAFFTRPDNNKTSTYRECICSLIRGDDFSSMTETGYKLAGEETDLSGFQVGL